MEENSGGSVEVDAPSAAPASAAPPPASEPASAAAARLSADACEDACEGREEACDLADEERSRGEASAELKCWSCGRHFHTNDKSSFDRHMLGKCGARLGEKELRERGEKETRPPPGRCTPTT